MANPGRDEHYVTLSETVDNTPVTFEPAGLWVSIEPAPPDTFGEQRISHRVESVWHPQITLHTILTTEDGAELFVRGIQNIRRKGVRMVLSCEEVQTP